MMEFILAARLLLATLFLIFGWRKLTDYSGTVRRMVQDGAPIPVLATAVAIFIELPVAFAVAVGAFTRPSALLLVLYTLGTALIAHHYWTMTGANKIDSMEIFYKNLSIVGGFLLLYIKLQVQENIRSMPYWDCKRSVLSENKSLTNFSHRRRVRLIPLTVANPGDEVNPDLPLKLQAEWPRYLGVAGSWPPVGRQDR